MSEVTEYKCPSCGGSIEFNSGTQNMKCPYCDSEFSVEAIEAENEAKNSMTVGEMSWSGLNSDWGNEQDNMKVYVCNSCGGEIVCDDTTSATKCPYCDNQVTIKGAFEGCYKPNLIIPFKLDKKAAKEKYLEFISGKKFLPKNFKDMNHIDEIKGVYIPEWLFDCDVSADVMYDATRIRRWSDSRYDYTETSHFNVFRSGNMAFHAVPVDGSSKMDDDLMESVEPFDLSEAVDFKSAYLSGYLSDKYDVDIDQSFPRANERIKNSTVAVLRNTIDSGYTSVVEKHAGVSTSNGATKYALYPVWLLNTTYAGKKYTFAMNGQTGKMVGNLPLDKGKFCKVSIGLGVGLTALFFCLSCLLFC